MKYIIVAASVFIILPLFFVIKQKATDNVKPAGSYALATKMIQQGEMLLKEGDLVVRMNQDPSSQFIKHFNRKDKSYSHSGIVLFENNYPYVYHIVSDDENPDGRLRKDSLSIYSNPRKNFGYGIYRYRMNAQEIKKLKQIIYKSYSQGIRFDSAFDLKTDNRMYCSEMIKKSIAKATDLRIKMETTRLTKREALIMSSQLHLPFSYVKSLELVAIDNLYTNPYCRLIQRFDFNY
jgi:hypothetical protein